MANINTRRKRGRPPLVRTLHSFVAASVDIRGEDEEPTFLFRGCTQKSVVAVFDWLVGNGNGIARSATVTEEHDPIRRNGYGYWRYAVALHSPNYTFASLDAQKILIEAAFKRHISPCRFRWLPIDKFLNV